MSIMLIADVMSGTIISPHFFGFDKGRIQTVDEVQQLFRLYRGNTELINSLFDATMYIMFL